MRLVMTTRARFYESNLLNSGCGRPLISGRPLSTLNGRVGCLAGTVPVGKKIEWPAFSSLPTKFLCLFRFYSPPPSSENN